MSEIFFLRHAQTLENAQSKFQGPKTGKFSELGKSQLKQIKEDVGDVDFNRIYCSMLPRCINTVNFVFPDRADVIYTSLINEKSSGDLQGMSQGGFDWDSLPGSFETRRLPGGENLVEVLERAKNFSAQLDGDGNKKILIVSHAAYLKVLLGHLLGFNLKRSIFGLKINNGQIVRGEIENKKFVLLDRDIILPYDGKI